MQPWAGALESKGGSNSRRVNVHTLRMAWSTKWRRGREKVDVEKGVAGPRGTGRQCTAPLTYLWQEKEVKRKLKERKPKTKLSQTLRLTWSEG